MYFSVSGKVYSLSQTNLIQQDNGKSIIAAEINSSFYRTKYADRVRNLFMSINFTGLVMVEIRQRGNKNFIIEANPRFWGPAQLFVDARYNLFEAFLSDWDFMDRYPDSAKPDKNAFYYW